DRHVGSTTSCEFDFTFGIVAFTLQPLGDSNLDEVMLDGLRGSPRAVRRVLVSKVIRPMRVHSLGMRNQSLSTATESRGAVEAAVAQRVNVLGVLWNDEHIS